MKYLSDFKRAGIEMCGQIVLCRGINDGPELERSLRDLSEYYPMMTSVSIVPAGLTKHRDGLYPLTDFGSDEAMEVIRTVNEFGEKMKDRCGSRMFFVADEFYLKAGLDIPDEAYYEGYPQIENGVGMIRSFVEEFLMAKEDISDMKDVLKTHRKVSVATGTAAYPMFREIAKKLEESINDLEINVYRIENKFYGDSITVAGLLTGEDICAQLLGEDLGDELFVPDNALRDGDDVFLCGMTLSEMSAKLSVKVTRGECDGYEFVRSVIGEQ